ncbi:hypothetical protein ABLB37_19225 [Vibrio parahaemolyticus]|uniref:hypothetical protein n=1 Tax=Vibrio TaxID=662 RepID=UPI0021D173C9|nr:hypothetical protein [Vibrio sp. YT-19(2023)]MDF4613987.1 hypothetical protein [Vibrio parahaemolyticus]MDW1499954.1 hypothetical protein [Vibrio sp. YT-19(2023)]
MSIPFNKADWLHNSCQSEKIAKCAAAAHAHEAITTIAAFHADEDHYTIEAGAEYLENYEGQEVLFLEFKAYSDCEHSRSMAIIYEKEDLVMYCVEFSLGNEDEDKEEYFEPVSPMTVKGFFSYLNTLPNIKKHVLPSSLNEKEQQSLSMLEELSQ